MHKIHELKDLKIHPIFFAVFQDAVRQILYDMQGPISDDEMTVTKFREVDGGGGELFCFIRGVEISAFVPQGYWSKIQHFDFHNLILN